MTVQGRDLREFSIVGKHHSAWAEPCRTHIGIIMVLEDMFEGDGVSDLSEALVEIARNIYNLILSMLKCSMKGIWNVSN